MKSSSGNSPGKSSSSNDADLKLRCTTEDDWDVRTLGCGDLNLGEIAREITPSQRRRLKGGDLDVEIIGLSEIQTNFDCDEENIINELRELFD